MPAKNIPLLVYNNTEFKELPKCFRDLSQEIQILDPLTEKAKTLPILRAFGAGQFSKTTLLNSVKGIEHKNITIVDLRQDSHGFIDGEPISWFGEKDHANLGKSSAEIETLEYLLLNELKKQKKIEIHQILAKKSGMITKTEKQIIKAHNISNEKELVTNLKFKYKRIYATNHLPPTDENIDDFIEFIKELSSNQLLYFHCKGGKGRTTTFLIFYDIIQNRNTLTLNEIITRHAISGPSDFSKINMSKDAAWKLQFQKDRIKVIKLFDKYIRDPLGYEHCSWSKWKKNQPK